MKWVWRRIRTYSGRPGSVRFDVGVEMFSSSGVRRRDGVAGVIGMIGGAARARTQNCKRTESTLC